MLFFFFDLFLSCIFGVFWLWLWHLFVGLLADLVLIGLLRAELLTEGEAELNLVEVTLVAVY